MFDKVKDFVYKAESYQIRAAIIQVYREMGCGFLEAVYQECMAIELADQRIPFTSKSTLKLEYKSVVCFYHI